jgi:hypothetical protein
MPEIKEPEKPKEEEPKKKACEEPEKYPKEEKAEAAPHWAIELGAKIDKLADAIIRSAAKPEEVKPEEEKPKEKTKAEAYPKPPEEEKPKEEEKAEPEKYPYGKDEEKFKNMIADAIKSANIPDVVEKAISKRLVEEPIEKRAKAVGPEKESEVDISPEALGKLSFREVEALAKRLGS